MSVGSNSTSFNLSDFLTRVIPGGILVYSMSFVLVEQFISTETLSGSTAILFVVLSFLVGEFINVLRLSTFDIPNYFRRVLFAESENSDYLGWIDSNFRDVDSDSVRGYSLFEHSNTNLIPTLRMRFELDDEFDGAHNLYTLLKSDISARMTKETKRLKNLYIFYQNIKIAVLVSIGWNLLVIGSSIAGFTQQSEIQTALSLLSLLLGFTIFYLIIMMFGLVAPTDRVYVESLLSDYFAYVMKTD